MGQNYEGQPNYAGHFTSIIATIVIFSLLQDIHSSDVKAALKESPEYVLFNSESSSLSAYHVVYVELHAKNEGEESCLSKATSWSKAMSKQLHALMSNNFFCKNKT